MMKTKFSVAMMILGMSLAAAAQAQTVLVVSDSADPLTIGGDHNDDSLVAWLTDDLGLTVDTHGMNGAMQGTFDAADNVAIAACDMIFVSRRTNSGAYNEPAQWAAVAKPILLQSGYLTRNSRWDWHDCGSGDTAPNTSTDMTVEAGQGGHPFLTGLTGPVKLFDWTAAPTLGQWPKGVFLPGCDFVTGTTLVGRYGDTGNRPMLADIPPGTTLAQTTGPCAERRVFFGHWGYDDSTTGTNGPGGTPAEWEDYITDDYKTIVANIIFDILDLFGATDPSPADGATVPTGDVELSWTNMDPNNPGGSVYVDVWFSKYPVTDPKNGTKIVTAGVDGENRTTVTVDASDPNTYHWQVDSYRYGSPTGDPCEGTVWSFNTVEDFPPTFVDAGVDMITWSGQPIQLDPTVVDDGKSPLTYHWTADPNEGVVISDPNIKAPTVTIIHPGLIPITNAGFEDPGFSDGNWGNGVPGWDTVGPNPSSGTWNPDATGAIFYGYGGIAPEGENVGWIEAGEDNLGASVEGGLAQVLTETLTADTSYTLTVEVGNNSYYDWGAGYKIQLLAGDTILAQDDNNIAVATDTFETSIVTYDYNAADESLLGEPLQIRLLAKPGNGELDVDDVRLVADPPSSAYPVTLTLAVHDESFDPTPVEDTMTIDVYDNACLAARFGLGLAVIIPGDFDGNCITDLKDLGVLLAKWLFDYRATAPVPK